MLFVIVACILFVVAADESEILGYENTNDGSGNYRFRFMTSNGITREETGSFVNVDENNKYIDVAGSYSYTDPDGKEIIVNYGGDENGYHILSEYNLAPVGIPEVPIPRASLLGK